MQSDYASLNGATVNSTSKLHELLADFRLDAAFRP